jgi:hypothetical protein
VNPPKKPPTLAGPGDDPLLPFVLAARAGDRGAERELLIRLAPFVLELARGAFPKDARRAEELVADSLIATLKALPTFRGEELVANAVGAITLERARRADPQISTDSAWISAAEPRLVRGARSGDGGRVTALVERALLDDAAVLVSQFVQRRGAPRRSLPYVLVLALVLLAGVGVGLFLTRTGGP